MAYTDKRPYPIYGQAYFFRVPALRNGKPAPDATLDSATITIDNDTTPDALDSAPTQVGTTHYWDVNVSTAETTCRVGIIGIYFNESDVADIEIEFAPRQVGDMPVHVDGLADDVITAAKFDADAIDNNALAANAANEIATATRTELTTELGRIDVAVSTRSTVTEAEVNSQVDTALADYDAPTNAEMVARTLASADYATNTQAANILHTLTGRRWLPLIILSVNEEQTLRFIWNINGVPSVSLSPAPTLDVLQFNGTAVVNDAPLDIQATPVMYSYDFVQASSDLYLIVATTADTNVLAADRTQYQYVLVQPSWISTIDTRASSTQASNILARLPTTLNSGRMRSHVEAMDTDVISSASVSAGAVTKVQAGLSTVTEAQVNAQVDTALADYDAPTNAEMNARTLLSAEYATNAQAIDILADTTNIETILDDLTEDVSGLRFTEHALEEAPSSGGGATVQEIVDGVLDEPLADHEIAGSVAEAIANAGSAANPMGDDPDDYPAGSLGWHIGLITEGTNFVNTNFNVETGEITIYYRDSYGAIGNRYINVTINIDDLDLTDADGVELSVKDKSYPSGSDPLFTVIGTAESAQVAQFELTEAETELVPPVTGLFVRYYYDVQATYGTDKITVRSGDFIVIDDVTP